MEEAAVSCRSAFWAAAAGSFPAAIRTAGTFLAAAILSRLACRVSPFPRILPPSGRTAFRTDGEECALLPCEYPGLVDIGGDQNADAVELAASGLAQAADVLQQTRYLRVANDTDKPVTIFVQYQALNDQGDWVWSGEADDALQFQLQPGAVTDLDDNGWRINTASAHIWVKSDNGDEWNTFKDQELWLVPEQDENGNHVYQDQGIQIFDYAVR
jgi:hypothetical protein